MNDETTIIGFCLTMSLYSCHSNYQLSFWVNSLSTSPRCFICWLIISIFWVGGVTEVGTQFWLDEYFGDLSLKGFQIISRIWTLPKIQNKAQGKFQLTNYKQVTCKST